MHPLISEEHVAAYQRDGVVLIEGLFADYVDVLREGVERNMAEPGPYAAENLKAGEAGRFFDDYCNWQRIPEFRGPVSPSGSFLFRSVGLGANMKDQKAGGKSIHGRKCR